MKKNNGMASSLMKGLAITLGGSIAVGLGITIGQSSVPPAPPVETVDFGPVLDRIEGVENRIVTVETVLKEPIPIFIPAIQELKERVHAHGSEVEALRAAIQRGTEIHDSRINDLGCEISNFELRIPVLIDQCIGPRFEELHEQVQSKMAETATQTLKIFADQIESRVVEKISSIEGDLNRQSAAINNLRNDSVRTDQNLQRLLNSVENLADRINQTINAPFEAARPAFAESTTSVVPILATYAPGSSTVTPAPAPNSAQHASSSVSVDHLAATTEANHSSEIELGEAPDIGVPREAFPIPASRPSMDPRLQT